MVLAGPRLQHPSRGDLLLPWAFLQKKRIHNPQLLFNQQVLKDVLLIVVVVVCVWLFFVTLSPVLFLGDTCCR
jgi:hypothetical protein